MGSLNKHNIRVYNRQWLLTFFFQLVLSSLRWRFSPENTIGIDNDIINNAFFELSDISTPTRLRQKAFIIWDSKQQDIVAFHLVNFMQLTKLLLQRKDIVLPYLGTTLHQHKMCTLRTLQNIEFFDIAKFARVKANITRSQNKYCLRNNLSIISTPKSIPCKQPPFTVAGP